MSQLAASEGQPGNWEEPGFFSASALNREVLREWLAGAV
jgi:hypothetical protein